MGTNIEMNIDELTSMVSTKICDKLCADASFRDALITSLVRNTTGDYRTNLRRASEVALTAATEKVQKDIEAYSKTLSKDAEPALRKKVEEKVRSLPLNITEEWVMKRANVTLKNLIYETFGKRAHQIAEEYLGSHARKLDVLRDNGSE